VVQHRHVFAVQTDGRDSGLTALHSA
jgi:hypothetical protein